MCALQNEAVTAAQGGISKLAITELTRRGSSEEAAAGLASQVPATVTWLPAQAGPCLDFGSVSP